MRHEFHPSALDEYESAALYYAACQKGLGLRFIATVESALRRISENPTRWRLFEEDVRRCLVRVFPFGILFSVESDHVLIVAVMHLGREPGYWRRRIE